MGVLSLLCFWMKTRRRTFVLGILAVVGLSAMVAILTSGSDVMIVVPETRHHHPRVRGDSNVDKDAEDLDHWLHGIPTRSTKELLGQPKPTLSVKMASTDNEKFDAKKILEHFKLCRKEHDVLFVDCYVDGYGELCKLFHMFGTVFGFVSSDVVEKIGILREYRKSPEADHYDTIQGMLAYEVKQGTTANKKKASGSRTLLRLHRALEFISALLIKIKETDNSSKFSTVACEAYDRTLAKHHPWLIKKAVHLAMYVLPSRQDLLKKMNVTDNEAGMKSLSDLINELNIIYGVTEELYAKDKLLDLP